MKNLNELYALWKQLSDVPVFEQQKTHSLLLDGTFLHFAPGTPVEDVWHWFEAQNPHFIVGEVQSGRFRDLDDPTKMVSSEVPMSLFDVTLDWCPGDNEQGDYNTLVWASSPDEAVRITAEEMADSGEIKLPDPDADPMGYAKERSELIENIISGAMQYAAMDIGRKILGDVETLVRGPNSINLEDPANIQAKADIDQLTAILSKYIGKL